VLVTLHPETNTSDADNARFAAEAERALVAVHQQVLITAPCADPGNEHFLRLCESLAAHRPSSCYVPNLGLRRYVAALHHADLMIGNSSSGIIEAATAGIPVVNIGERQALRDRAENVLDCPFQADAILRAVNAVTEPSFVARSRAVVNPYGDGTFVQRALALLDKVSWPLTLQKSWPPLQTNRQSQA
jgi:UDP-N-acetylglucosamine 2-epimerase